MSRRWAIDTNPDSVPTLRTKLERVEHTFDLLFLGDLHWDNAHADHKAIKRVLDQAVERDAVIVLLGDTLDLMGGKDDRRSSKSALRPEHKVDAYFSAVIDGWADWYAPYAERTWIALEGNHCSAVRKHHEIDVTRLWIARLNAAGATIQYPGYSTYARILNNRGTEHTNIRFFIHHGYGGGGPVTRGVIQAQRRALTYPDADFLVTGHIHSSWSVTHEQYRLGHMGRPYKQMQEHYSVAGFKDEYADGEGGWWVERGLGPRDKSGWWCHVSYSHQRKLMFSFEKAKA